MSSEKKYSWYKVAETIADFFWQENNLCEVEVKGKTICFGRKGDDVFACAAKCPHAGGHFSDGVIDAAGNIVCPCTDINSVYKMAVIQVVKDTI